MPAIGGHFRKNVLTNLSVRYETVEAANRAGKEALKQLLTECRDLRLIFLKKISRSGVIIKRPGLKLPDPNPDQITRHVMASGESVKRFARDEFLGDLSFEFDAMGTVPGHGFHPLKARQSWSIPNPQDVHR